MYRKAQFFGDKDTANKILLTNHPREAKKLGRQVENFNSEEWSAVCREYMKQALRLKFSQNKDMREELLKYPNIEIIKATATEGMKQLIQKL